MSYRVNRGKRKKNLTTMLKTVLLVLLQLWTPATKYNFSGNFRRIDGDRLQLFLGLFYFIAYVRAP